jgi:hypothetical protein
MRIWSERALADLFALNLLLQIFDGIVTYQALNLGVGEGNPILRSSIETVGLGPALLLYKAHACGLLLLVRRAAPAPLSATALRASAAAYLLCSLLPWLCVLVALVG